MINKAREIQGIVAKHLCKGEQRVYTDVEEWRELQTFLARNISELMKYTGNCPNEEGERILAILMGYTLAVRNAQNIATALQKAEEVLPRISNKLLKCKLAVFCYGECMNEELGTLALTLMEELQESGNEKELHCLRELLQSFALQL